VFVAEGVKDGVRLGVIVGGGVAVSSDAMRVTGTVGLGGWEDCAQAARRPRVNVRRKVRRPAGRLRAGA
jgi:hypothetical protein